MDEEYKTLNDPGNDACFRYFEDQTLYFRKFKNMMSVGFKDVNTKDEEHKHCFEI